MEEVRDYRGRLVCYCNAQIGELETSYKRQSIFMSLPVSAKIVFVREGVATYIARKSATQFHVYSHPCADTQACTP